VNALDLLRDVVVRLAWAREELDPAVRDQALEDLESDVAGWLIRLEEAA
jgi:hypothetical protein